MDSISADRIWPPPPGERAVTKSQGVTPTEQYLAKLAEETFLSLWSYPNVWRDKRPNGTQAGDGKELCDLLVIFDNHVIIFSDKHIEYKQHDIPAIAWNRWYNNCIRRIADSLYGAEKWIRQYPTRIFLDPRCTKRIPVSMPHGGSLIVHRIAVARGAGTACREHFAGGSGSLMVTPDIVGDAHFLRSSGPSNQQNTHETAFCGPFMVGQIDPSQGYIHVLDDISLDILMNTLDTVQDLTDYLIAKEKFILSGHLVAATGEEDLLAYYLRHTDSAGKHQFTLPGNKSRIAIDSGYWDDFNKSPQRRAQIEADKISYLWDDLIERFAFHALNDSQYMATDRGAAGTEPIVRYLAREPRLRRRLLTHAAAGMVSRARQTESGVLQVRIIEPSFPGNPYYVFLSLKRLTKLTYDEYRLSRRKCLEHI